MKGGLGEMLKQAQQMQENLQRAQEALAAEEVTGSAGGGVVTVTLNGRYEAAAINDAVRKVETLSRERMSGLTAGLSLPPGLKLPF